MKLIKKPTCLAEDIVNTVIEDLYDRSGFDHFLDGIDSDVLEEMISDLTSKVQIELNKGLQKR